MTLAIISDIHANLEALTRALQLIKGRRVDRIVCLGDVVGYGPNPNECIDLLVEEGIPSVLGNHDEAALDLSNAVRFNRYARVAAEWTAEQLTPVHRGFLQNLPMSITEGESLFVHSSPRKPHEWDYIVGTEDAEAAFQAMKTPLAWVGHSHVPGVYIEGSEFQEPKREGRTIINVGSIGQPRDGDPRLSFFLFDTGTWTMENIREEYDVERTREKILRAGLPAFLGDRLLRGI